MYNKLQKYIVLLILVGSYLIVLPFHMYIKTDGLYVINFIQYYFENISIYLVYTILGIVVFGVGVYLDFRKPRN